MFGSIGMPELIIILVIALIIFGPRKLPELGKSLGRSINEFKRASTDLQNTLEQEIKLEEQKENRQGQRQRERRPPRDRLRDPSADLDASGARVARRRRPAITPARQLPMALVPFPGATSARSRARAKRRDPYRVNSPVATSLVALCRRRSTRTTNRPKGG